MDTSARKFSTNDEQSGKLSAVFMGVRSILKKVASFFRLTDEDRVSAGIVIASKDRIL